MVETCCGDGLRSQLALSGIDVLQRPVRGDSREGRAVMDGLDGGGLSNASRGAGRRLILIAMKGLLISDDETSPLIVGVVVISTVLHIGGIQGFHAHRAT